MVNETRCELTDLLVDQCACPQHRGGFTPQEEASSLRDPSEPAHPARWPGRCAHCWTPFQVGTPIRARQTPTGAVWIADCCTEDDQ